MPVSDEEFEALKNENERLKKRVTELEALLRKFDNAHTQSSMQGVGANKIGESKSRGKPGRKDGHEGVGRKTPQDIHERRLVKLKVCPCCGRKLRKAGSRKRVTTGIKQGSSVNTEYEIERSYCKNCDKIVEPVIVDALPNSRFDLTLALYISFLSVLGITLGKIRTILLHDYALSISKGAIANIIEQLASYLGEDYEKLHIELLEQKNINADETGHPIHGKNAWLWAFIGKTVAYFRVEKSRGQKVVEKILTGYNGILTTDCWSAYNKLKCRKNKCMAHLKRDMKFLKKKNKSIEAQEYASSMGKLFNAALREEKLSPELKAKYQNKMCRIIDKGYKDKDCLRFNKRFRRHLSEIFTFLEYDIEPTNNEAERRIRPWVIKRKNTYGSYSLDGAQAHAIIASFYQTSQIQNLQYEQYLHELLENCLQNPPQN